MPTSAASSTTLVDTPFQKPAERGLTEVEVTDPGHPLFGRRFAVVSVSGPRPPGRAGGHILVAHSSRVLLKLPLAATSLVPRPPDAGLSKLSAEAVAELIALAEAAGAHGSAGRGGRARGRACVAGSELDRGRVRAAPGPSPRPHNS